MSYNEFRQLLENNDEAKIDELLGNPEVCIPEYALYMALENNDIDTARKLINVAQKLNKPLDMESEDVTMALYRAIITENMDALILLLNNGARPLGMIDLNEEKSIENDNHDPEKITTPLLTAIKEQKVQIVKLLLSKVIGLRNMKSYLLYSVRTYNEEIMKLVFTKMFDTARLGSTFVMILRELTSKRLHDMATWLFENYIGIVAFNENEKNAIERIVEMACMEEPEFVKLFAMYSDRYPIFDICKYTGQAIESDDLLILQTFLDYRCVFSPYSYVIAMLGNKLKSLKFLVDNNVPFFVYRTSRYNMQNMFIEELLGISIGNLDDAEINRMLLAKKDEMLRTYEQLKARIQNIRLEQKTLEEKQPLLSRRQAQLDEERRNSINICENKLGMIGNDLDSNDPQVYVLEYNGHYYCYSREELVEADKYAKKMVANETQDEYEYMMNDQRTSVITLNAENVVTGRVNLPIFKLPFVEKFVMMADPWPIRKFVTLDKIPKKEHLEFGGRRSPIYLLK